MLTSNLDSNFFDLSDHIILVSNKVKRTQRMHRKTVIYLLIVALYALSLVTNAANIEKGLFLYLPIDEARGIKSKTMVPTISKQK